MFYQNSQRCFTVEPGRVQVTTCRGMSYGSKAVTLKLPQINSVLLKLIPGTGKHKFSAHHTWEETSCLTMLSSDFSRTGPTYCLPNSLFCKVRFLLIDTSQAQQYFQVQQEKQKQLAFPVAWFFKSRVVGRNAEAGHL